MKVSRKTGTILTAVWILLLASCSDDPTEVLDKKINVAIRSGNNIDEMEWTDLTKYILENKGEFPDLVDGETANTKKITEYILLFSQKHTRRGQTDPEIFNPKTTSQNFVTPKVKVFIENSGSMDGYVRGIKDFEIVVGKLLVLCKDYSFQNSTGNFDVFFINKKVYPAPEIKELTDFAKALEPNQNSPYNKGDRSESILNEVLKNIIDSTNENSISILVSDCIYSLDPTEDTKGSLGYQQNGTFEVFLNKLRKDPNLNFTTCIYKMESDYEGNYFPYNYNPKLKNSINLYNNKAKRPYYIWVIGESKIISEFNKKIKFESLKGFEHSYILSNYTQQIQPYYTVLKETNKNGSFKQTERNEKDVKSINDIKYEGGKFQFSIAIDLGNVPVDSTFLITTNNYIPTKGFIVETVERIDRNILEPRDFRTVEKTTATHLITISTTSEFTIQDLILELSNKIPDWVEKSSSINDIDIKSQLDRTFGFVYLVQGVSEAYVTQNPGQTSYFKIKVIIKK